MDPRSKIILSSLDGRKDGDVSHDTIPCSFIFI